MSAAALIDVRQLYLNYRSEIGEVPVLKGISFSIARGEKVAICGRSGSGKSTLLYILGGLLRPTSGEIDVLGEKIWQLEESERSQLRARRIGFVFQQFHLIPGWTVQQNVLLGSEYSLGTTAEATARAQSLIAELGLSELADRTPSQLSGGQAQRVAIARALMMDPDVLLADEPTGALDPQTTREILSIFDRINQSGKTVIIITHDENIARTCNRVIRISDGVIENEAALVIGAANVSRRLGEEQNAPPSVQAKPQVLSKPSRAAQRLWSFAQELARGYSWRTSVALLRRNPARSLFTVFGVAVGVAAVVSMLSIGRFAKEQILDSYSSLGIRNFKLWAYPNWNLAHSAPIETYFRELKIPELDALMKLFPSISSYTPLARFWSPEVSYGGKTVKEDTTLLGINENGVRLHQFELATGRDFTSLDIEDGNPVCVIGSGLAEELFGTAGSNRPLIFVKHRAATFPCRVVGIVAPKKSAGETNWSKPGYELFVPYTFLRAMRGESPNSNEGDHNHALFEVKRGIVPDDLAKQIKEFFEVKYGSAGFFRSEANARVINQMQVFLDIFNALLIAVAFITLGVGASGVTNMILVSLSERVRELGIRRAVGAEPRHLRQLVISESLTLCGLAGLAGLITALALMHAALYAISKFFPKVPFQLLLDPTAIIVSLLSIVAVGIGAGLYPAVRVEQQDVVSALRAE